jgi:putative alpha-1,2-mannosidase
MSTFHAQLMLDSIWDLFRSQLPFLTLVDPFSVTKMIRSLIDTQQHLGWLPECRMSLCKGEAGVKEEILSSKISTIGYTQGGSNADNVLADAFVKGLYEGIDWEVGYAAVQKDAEVEPYDWSNEGRGGLLSWKMLKYIPVQDFDHWGFGTMTRSISRTLEYSYNDFAISQIARGLNKFGDADTRSPRDTGRICLERTKHPTLMERILDLQGFSSQGI